MTEEQKQRIEAWCEALESGKYQQTKRRLKNPETGAMCCLGVA